MYKGQFNEGTFNGRGILITSRGNYYFGEWKNGEFNGEGTLKYSDYTYSGYFKDNMKSGRGIEVFANGTRLNDEYVNNERHGLGKICYPEGTEYEGNFHNMVFKIWFSMKRVFLSPNKRKYEGELKEAALDRQRLHKWEG